MRVSVCVEVCVSMCEHPACKSWQTSDGTQPRHWISTILLCSSAAGENVHNPAMEEEWHLPCSFCITLAMSTDPRPKCLGEAMLSRCSCMTRWVTDAESRRSLTTVLNGTSPLPLPLYPPLSLSLSLSLSNLTAGPGPIESQVSCRDKQVYCPIEALLPFSACKREVC